MTAAIRRRRPLIAITAMLALVLLVLVLLRLLGGGGPPANDAARFAPRDTLVWVHLSTDGDRRAVEQAAELLGRFGTYEGQRDAILQRLAGTEEQVRASDVEPWLGDEAALAFVDTGTGTAGSLVAVAVTDEGRARRFLERNPRRSAVRRYKGERIDEFGQVAVAFKDGFLLIGQDVTVRGALDRVDDDGDDLADDPTFRKATADLPDDRAADAYVSAAGLRRLLVPQAGPVGTLSVLFDQPALQGLALSVRAEDDDRVRIRAHSVLDAATARRSGARLQAFEPRLVEAVPGDALAYLGVRGISGSLGRLVSAASGGAQAGGVGPVLERLRRELSRQTDGALERDLLRLLEGEVAVVVTRATPAPSLSLVTRTEDEDRTASVLRRLQAPLARLLAPRGEAAPQWRSEDLGDGVRASVLQAPAGPALGYAVFEGRLVLSTSLEGLRRMKDRDEHLGDSEAFEQATADRPDEVTSIGFLDFSQLLELGEQTGLNDSRAYLAARDDLQKIRAVGVSSHGSEGETTAEILLTIR